MVNRIIRTGLSAFVAVAALLFSAGASAQGTIKIAYTDPLSGPFAQVGDANLKQLSYIIDYVNSKGGALGRKFELVPFDNKSQPSEALLAGQAANISVEGDAIENAQQQAFWRVINHRLADEKEQAVVYGSFVLAMKPAELHLRYPHLFSDVKDVYRTKQNVLERLRRDPELLNLRADYV